MGVRFKNVHRMAVDANELMPNVADYIMKKHDDSADALCYGYFIASSNCFDIHYVPRKVIYNDPATIVYWLDGTKTVVKCQDGDTYDAEKGLLLCYMKKCLGNTGRFNKVLNKYKHVPTENENTVDGLLTKALDNIAKHGHV